MTGYGFVGPMTAMGTVFAPKGVVAAATTPGQLLLIGVGQ